MKHIQAPNEHTLKKDYKILFEMTKDKVKDLEGLIEMFQERDALWDDLDGISVDAIDTKEILNLLLAGELKKAVEAWYHMDTSPREHFPEWMYELSKDIFSPR